MQIILYIIKQDKKKRVIYKMQKELLMFISVVVIALFMTIHNRNLNEMEKISKVIPNIDKFTQKKTSHFYNFLR
jgi:hypothetical protein